MKLSQAVQFTRILLLGSEYLEEFEWVSKECNGYNNKLQVTDYRQVPCQILADSSLPYYGISTKPVDAHELNEKMVESSGASMYTMYVVQDVESLEKC